MSTSQQPILVEIVKAPPSFDHYNVKAVRIVGLAQLMLALLSIVLNTYGVSLDTSVATSGFGIISALIWSAAGSIGILSTFRKHGCLILTTMVMSILAAVTISYYVPLCITQLLQAKAQYYDPDHRNLSDPDCMECENQDKWYVWERCSRCFGAFLPNTNYVHQKAVSIAMLCTGLAEGMAAVFASCLCCHVICCCGRKRSQGRNADNLAIVSTVEDQVRVALLQHSGSFTKESSISNSSIPKTTDDVITEIKDCSNTVHFHQWTVKMNGSKRHR